jgi:cytochrome c peroxidase
MPNDGIGNPKSAKSLLHADRIKPATWRGVRGNMNETAAAGFRFFEHAVTPEDLKATEAYIASLRPQISPYRLANGELTDSAKRGKEIFHSTEAHCAHCHAGELLTDLKSHDVGTKGPLDLQGEDTFVTPALVEVWRTAPYLHDGRAATLKDVLTKFDSDDQHGHVSQLNKQQIDDLVAYLLSL